jgi:hypothetical protein
MGIMEEEEVSRSEALMVMVMVMVAIGHSGVPFRLNSVLSQSHVSALILQTVTDWWTEATRHEFKYGLA